MRLSAIERHRAAIQCAGIGLAFDPEGHSIDNQAIVRRTNASNCRPLSLLVMIMAPSPFSMLRNYFHPDFTSRRQCDSRPDVHGRGVG